MLGVRWNVEYKLVLQSGRIWLLFAVIKLLLFEALCCWETAANFMLYVSSGDSNCTCHWVALLLVCKLSSVRREGEKKCSAGKSIQRREKIWIGNKSSDCSVDNVTLLPVTGGERLLVWIYTNLLDKSNRRTLHFYCFLLWIPVSSVENFSMWYDWKEE